MTTPPQVPVPHRYGYSRPIPRELCSECYHLNVNKSRIAISATVPVLPNLPSNFPVDTNSDNWFFDDVTTRRDFGDSRFANLIHMVSPRESMGFGRIPFLTCRQWNNPTHKLEYAHPGDADWKAPMYVESIWARKARLDKERAIKSGSRVGFLTFDDEDLAAEIQASGRLADKRLAESSEPSVASVLSVTSTAPVVGLPRLIPSSKMCILCDPPHVFHVGMCRNVRCRWHREIGTVPCNCKFGKHGKKSKRKSNNKKSNKRKTNNRKSNNRKSNKGKLNKRKSNKFTLFSKKFTINSK